LAERTAIAAARTLRGPSLIRSDAVHLLVLRTLGEFFKPLERKMSNKVSSQLPFPFLPRAANRRAVCRMAHAAEIELHELSAAWV